MSDSADRHLLFIYGTLKKGFCRHGALAGQEFIGEVKTTPEYRMFNVGTYPALVGPQKDGISIHGELWSVDLRCLRQLDEIEAVDDGLYDRRHITLCPQHDEVVEAYFYCHPIDQLKDCGNGWN